MGNYITVPITGGCGIIVQKFNVEKLK